jgi:hypothetical protein
VNKAAADAVNKARVNNATGTTNATAAAKAAVDAADVGRSSGCSTDYNSEGVSSTYDSLQDSGSSARDSSASLIGSFELLWNASYRLSDTQGRLRIGDVLVTATGAVDVSGKVTAASAIASAANATKMHYTHAFVMNMRQIIILSYMCCITSLSKLEQCFTEMNICGLNCNRCFVEQITAVTFLLKKS